MIASVTRRRFRAAVVVTTMLTAVLAAPISVLAHAVIETATPADGAVLETPPTEIVITYTEELDASRSSLTLHDSSGAQIASGGVDPANDLVMRIDPPELEPGTYEIRSAARSAHDDHLERNELTFTISEPTPAPTATPTATPTVAPSASLAATASPSVAPSPSPSANGTPASATDVIVPIVAAIVVLAALGGWLLSRSRGRGPA
jgi:methionine-rich copper-binding protein CopC